MRTKARAQLHKLIDELTESQLNLAEGYLRALRQGTSIPSELADAPEETEAIADEEARLLAEADDEVSRGEIIPDEQFEEALNRMRRARHSTT